MTELIFLGFSFRLTMSLRTSHDVIWSSLRYLFVLYVVAIVNDVADNRGTLLPRATPSLPDVVHDLLPFFAEASQFSDAATMLLYMSLAALISTQRAVADLFCEFLDLHAKLMLFRCLTVPLTTLPSPLPGCETLERIPFSFLNPLKRVLLPGVLSSWCHDLIYSGHTVLYFLIALFFRDLKSHDFIKLLVWIVAGTGTLALLVSRLHYSVDVLIGATITILMYNQRRPQIFLFVNGQPDSPM